MRDNNPIQYVSEQQFGHLGNGIQCASIATEHKVTRMFTVAGKNVVMTGAVGTGKATGWESIWGYEIKPLAHYTGTLEPLEYSAHFHQVDLGTRPRCYTGMKVKQGRDWVVFVGQEITYKPTKLGAQLSLF